jgi:hypothetical protein
MPLGRLCRHPGSGKKRLPLASGGFSRMPLSRTPRNGGEGMGNGASDVPALAAMTARPYIAGMTENQILALISSVLVLILVLRGARFPRQGLLPQIVVWLLIFALIGLSYKFFGPG